MRTETTSCSVFHKCCSIPREPQWVKKPFASFALTASSPLPMASANTFRVQGPISLSNRLTFENASSIGFRSGENRVAGRVVRNLYPL